jgi:hypothetical protein
LKIKLSSLQYTKKTKVKAGLFEKKKVKAKDILLYIRDHYPEEFKTSITMLISFDLNRYTYYIQSLAILTQAQKEWLLTIIPFRRKKILEWIGREEDLND